MKAVVFELITFVDMELSPLRATTMKRTSNRTATKTIPTSNMITFSPDSPTSG